MSDALSSAVRKTMQRRDTQIRRRPTTDELADVVRELLTRDRAGMGDTERSAITARAHAVLHAHENPVVRRDRVAEIAVLVLADIRRGARAADAALARFQEHHDQLPVGTGVDDLISGAARIARAEKYAAKD